MRVVNRWLEWHVWVSRRGCCSLDVWFTVSVVSHGHIENAFLRHLGILDSELLLKVLVIWLRGLVSMTHVFLVIIGQHFKVRCFKLDCIEWVLRIRNILHALTASSLRLLSLLLSREIIAPWNNWLFRHITVWCIMSLHAWLVLLAYVLVLIVWEWTILNCLGQTRAFWALTPTLGSTSTSYIGLLIHFLVLDVLDLLSQRREFVRIERVFWLWIRGGLTHIQSITFSWDPALDILSSKDGRVVVS